MCGIAGCYRLSGSPGIDLDGLQRMCDAVRHRGPDDSGTYIGGDGRVGLGHRRLSIIDLATGHQPMASPSGRTWITFNGEIYNYRELRAQLEGRGVRFRTTSDTEVLLALYEADGVAGFERLNGIFAFGLFDERTGELHLVRDHLGVKPLYYAESDGWLLFGSEIKALLAWRRDRPTLDLASLNEFLSFRYNPAPRTLFAGIHKMPAGHRLRAKAGEDFAVVRYWNHEPRTSDTIGFTDAVDEYRRLLRQAVRRQLVADVPIGLFLSGGVDSAAIGKLMAEASGGAVDSYAVGFRGRGDFNELADARASADWIGTRHHDLELDQDDYLSAFVHAVSHVEEPIAESTIPALGAVAALAARDLKVVLAGQGADELIAGYTRYLGAAWLSAPGVASLAKALGGATGLLPRAAGLRRAAEAAAAPDEMERCLRLVSILDRAEKASLALPATRAAWRELAQAPIARLSHGAQGLTPGLARLLYYDARTLLPDDLLLFNDKMTMEHSLEMRVPFLDVELVTFVESLPASYKLRWGRRKRLHKAALTGLLPAEILRRKKRGFATPMDRWLQAGLGRTTRDVLARPDSACGRYLDVETIRRWSFEHEHRRRDRRLALFALLSFELWHEHFIDGAPVAEGPAAKALLKSRDPRPGSVAVSA